MNVKFILILIKSIAGSAPGEKQMGGKMGAKGIEQGFFSEMMK